MFKKSFRYSTLLVFFALVCLSFISDDDDRDKDLFYPDLDTMIKLSEFKSKKEWEPYMATHYPKYVKEDKKSSRFLYKAGESWYAMVFYGRSFGIIYHKKNKDYEDCTENLNKEIEKLPLWTEEEEMKNALGEGIIVYKCSRGKRTFMVVVEETADVKEIIFN